MKNLDSHIKSLEITELSPVEIKQNSGGFVARVFYFLAGYAASKALDAGLSYHPRIPSTGDPFTTGPAVCDNV